MVTPPGFHPQTQKQEPPCTAYCFKERLIS